jgi:hypothetical protein
LKLEDNARVKTEVNRVALAKTGCAELAREARPNLINALKLDQNIKVTQWLSGMNERHEP